MRRSFDLVVLDVLMPELDGFQVLEQIVADPHLRAVDAALEMVERTSKAKRSRSTSSR